MGWCGSAFLILAIIIAIGCICAAVYIMIHVYITGKPAEGVRVASRPRRRRRADRHPADFPRHCPADPVPAHLFQRVCDASRHYGVGVIRLEWSSVQCGSFISRSAGRLTRCRPRPPRATPKSSSQRA